jgi:hypothetical protein
MTEPDREIRTRVMVATMVATMVEVAAAVVEAAAAGTTTVKIARASRSP